MVGSRQYVKSSRFNFKNEREAIQFLESSLISTIKTQSNGRSAWSISFRRN